MDAWWWIPVGLVAWFAVAVAAALFLGPVLRNCSRRREALSRKWRDQPGSKNRFRIGSRSPRAI